MDLLWALSVSMLAVCVAIPMDAAAGSHSLFSCEPITLRMCQGLPYNSTFMPNVLNHYDQQTAALAMEPFHPMVNLQCSLELRMFLCALYAPVCTEYGRMTLPCRRLCLQAKSDCYKLMDMFGVSWPEEMDCNRFPDCDEPYPRPVDLLSTSDTTELPVSVQRDYGFWCPRELKIDPELGYSFMGVRDCSPPCPNMYFSREELAFARYFIGVVSIVCLSATLFTFLTFLIDVSRFRYPERPIIFYAVCYMMVSLVFFLGFLLEDKVSCNTASPGRFRASTVTQGSHNKACTLLFMVLYFFTMAGSVWWVILTITWFLAAVPKWGSEAIEKKALLFHACAWGVPGVLTVTLLAMNKIEGDSISGVCFVGLYNLTALRWFLLAPLGLDVVVGVVLLLAGIAALNRVRMEIPLEKENQEKLLPNHLGDHLGPGEVQRLPHPLSLSGAADQSARLGPLPHQVPDDADCGNPLGVLGGQQEDLFRVGQFLPRQEAQRWDGQREPTGAPGARLCPAAVQGPQHAHREEVERDVHPGHFHPRLLHPPGHAGRAAQRQHQPGRLRPQRSLQDEQLPRQPAPLQRQQTHRLQLPGRRRAAAVREHASPQRPVQTLQRQPTGLPVEARLHPEAGEPITAQQHQGPERGSSGRPRRPRKRDPQDDGGRRSRGLSRNGQQEGRQTSLEEIKNVERFTESRKDHCGSGSG
ncbi:frizzled-3a isoform X3 [Kryptolebias marmoratus]|uniref:Frizzled class receptor 3a n=1 Tax=Kryptolebias marmoratus TaxID=37003 RepID=A0A3Q2ZQM2_KRYMA|nr:frizzled-3a isoform X3 [Kryptolebias marmoratus]